MRQLPAYLLVLLALVSSCGKEKRISEDNFAKIYADMFLADQWIVSNRLSRTADTSLVYEPIFKKYGYTSDDYRSSLEYYMDDATAFAQVLEEAREILKSKVALATRERDYEVLRDSVRAVMKRTYRPIFIPVDSLAVPFAPDLRRPYQFWNLEAYFKSQPAYSLVVKGGKDQDENEQDAVEETVAGEAESEEANVSDKAAEDRKSVLVRKDKDHPGPKGLEELMVVE